jgi:uncharacterized protein YdeI (YjbR/CyaY-like superfamily)
MTNAIFFESLGQLRDWLIGNHASSNDLWVGFYKKSSKRPSITYPEALDEALCYGWIDGVRKSVDHDSFTIRFTPRKAKSTWSAVNLRRVEEVDQARSYATGRLEGPRGTRGGEDGALFL